MKKKKRWALDAEIMKLRGLGYSHAEIARIMGIKQGVVQYQLEKINERAQEEGIDKVFFELCVKLYLPKILRFFKC